MKVFITARFKGTENKADIEQLCALVRQAGLEDFCFVRDVENYKKTFDDAHELMDSAREWILQSDVLLIDASDAPSGGRVIEAGIAYGAGKRVVIIMQKDTVLKEPFQGIADLVIEYTDLQDIVAPLLQLRPTN